MTRLEAAERRLHQSVARLESALEARAGEGRSADDAGAAADAIGARLDTIIDRLRRVLEA